MVTVASTKGVPVALLSAVTTGTGKGISVPITSSNPRFHIRGSGTISGGTIILEEALDPDYTGTWSNLQTITASTLSGGAEQVVRVIGTIGAVRARISSNITGGGNVSVDLVSD